MKRHRAEHLPLRTALAGARPFLGDGDVAVLLASPTDWGIGRLLADGEIEVRDPIQIDGCFSALAFSRDGQLDWRRAPGVDLGTAVLLACAGPDGWASSDVAATSALEQRQLLWGTAEPLSAGWSAMRSSRIPGFAVPIEAPVGARLEIVGEELLGSGPDGNTVVVGARWMELRVVDAETGGR